MGINLTRLFKGANQQPPMTATKAATAFDRQVFKGFGSVLKSNSPMLRDKVARGFSTSSAIGTRLQGTKLW